MKRFIVALGIITTAFPTLLGFGYDQVTITNNTPYYAEIIVKYAGLVCSLDQIRVRDHGTATAKLPRGVCLVISMDATLYGPGFYADVRDIYTSSGTSYSQFELNEISPGKFEIKHIQ